MMTASIDKDGGPVWKDDCVELFLDPNLDRSTFRQIAVNSLGKVLVVDSGKGEWHPKLKVAAKVLKDRWRVELTLPLADLQATSTSFGFNLCRERRPTEVFELSCWSPTGGKFGEPSRFGVASFGASFLTSTTLGEGVVGTNSLIAAVANPTAAPLQAQLVVRCTAKDGASARTESKPIALPPGTNRQLAGPYVLRADSGDVVVDVSLRDVKSGKALASQRLSQTVSPPLTAKVSPALSFTSRPTVSCTVEVAVSKDLRQGSRLTLELVDDGSGKTVSKSVATRVGGDVLSAMLALGDAAGSYHLRATLLDANRGTVAQLETPISRVRGPF
jgi:hypothetical protein